MRSPERTWRAGRRDPVTGVRKGYFVWTVRCRAPGGGKLAKTFPTKQEAAAYCAELERRRQGGQTIDPRKKYDAALLEEFSASHCPDMRPSARQDILDGLRRALPYLEGVALVAVTPKRLEAFRDSEVVAIRDRALRLNALGLARAERRRRWRQSRGLDAAMLDRQAADFRAREVKLQACGGRRSVNKSLSYLGTLFRWAQARGYCVQNPATFVKRLKVQPLTDRPMEQQVYSPEELTRLIDSAEAGCARVALMILGYGGLRLGEALGLQWGDVEFAAGRLLVRRQLCAITRELREVKTKAGVRFIELPPFVMKALKVWKLEGPKGALDLVLPNREGGPLDQADFRNRMFLPAVRRAQLRRIKVHDLRHGTASMLLASGADIAAISRQMGHASPAVTLTIYSHFVQRRNDSGLGSRLEAFLTAERAGASEVA